MARLLLDADIQPVLFALLHAEGHDVLTAWDRGLRTGADAAILLDATFDERIVITHNGKDFRTLCQAWPILRLAWSLEPSDHGSVISIPQPSRMALRVATDMLNDHLEHHVAPANQFWFLSATTATWQREV